MARPAARASSALPARAPDEPADRCNRIARHAASLEAAWSFQGRRITSDHLAQSIQQPSRRTVTLPTR
ncbi:hypothetical protein [Burkholderia vietnamiensis]|uniref:hypothetical protein n=1 Tax=Burkholderia vietnamiensis TaxID=60552 RepID=UPI0012D87646|nr:hypothetical protein [Burkholderia vietnamiensis]